MSEIRMSLNGECVNTGRQPEFDIAKTFMIFIMAIGHVYEEISVIDPFSPVYDAFRTLFELMFALGAPMFMIAMGVGIAYSKSSTPKQMVKRGIKLFIAAYVLNLFDDFIPLAIAHLAGLPDLFSPVVALLNGDILQFAGLAFLSIALMKKLNFSQFMMLITSLILCCVGRLLGTIPLSSDMAKYFHGLFYMTYDYSCFPLLLWLFYPVIGIMFGNVLLRTVNKDKLYKYAFILGIAGIAVTAVLLYMTKKNLLSIIAVAGSACYDQTLLHYIFITSALLVFLRACYLLSKAITGESAERFCKYCGKRLNTIYIIHWILIGNTELVMGLLYLPYVERIYIVPVGILIALTAIGICRLYDRIREQKNALRQFSLDFVLSKSRI